MPPQNQLPEAEDQTDQYQPPVVPTPQEVEAARSRLVAAIQLLMAAALAQQLAAAGIPQGPDVDVTRHAVNAARRTIQLIRRLYRFDLVEAEGPFYVEETAQRLSDTAMKWSGDHARTLMYETPTVSRRRSWERAAANSLATQTFSSAMSTVAEKLDDPNTPMYSRNHRIKKVWISRDDDRVRGSHRKLHGRAHYLNTPFKSWGLTGQSLYFPGDARAPLDETINCRCFLWLTYGTAREIAEKFQREESTTASAALDIPYAPTGSALELYTEQSKRQTDNCY